MRIFNLLWNIKTFYLTYATDEVPLTKPRVYVLDRWLFSRFHTLLKEVTRWRVSDRRAARPIRDFVDDLSTWWLRRSRERMKSDQAYEKLDALRTLKEVLMELTKVMAPFTPFLAEKIYLDLGGMKASVHLESWPKVQERLLDDRLMQDMAWVRALVSRGHEARTAAKIPVRQALASVRVACKSDDMRQRLGQQREVLHLIQDELNVEEIMLEHQGELSEDWSLTLDTNITPALKQKGLQREFARHVMKIRKKAKCHPGDRIVLRCVVPTAVREAVDLAMELIKADVKADTLEWVDTVEGVTWQETVKMDGEEATMGMESRK